MQSVGIFLQRFLNMKLIFSELWCLTTDLLAGCEPGVNTQPSMSQSVGHDQRPGYKHSKAFGPFNVVIFLSKLAF